jgi:hypothetical protein
MMLGIPSSGGTVAASLMPCFYRVLNLFLPQSAAMSIIHEAVYFPDHQHLQPIRTLATWVIGLLVILPAASWALGRTPGGRATAPWPTRRASSR